MLRSISRALLLSFAVSVAGCKYMEVKVGDKVVRPAAESPAMAQARQEAKAREQKYANAPKRAADAPIKVGLHEAKIAEKIKKSVKNFDALYRKQFEGHPVIRVVDAKTLAEHEYRARTTTFEALREPIADVDVRAWLNAEDRAVHAKGKAGLAPFFIYGAEISSPYVAQTFTVKEEAFIFQNQQGLERFAAKIKRVVLEDIGPRIPAQRATSGTHEVKDLKGLFKALGGR